jgi:hypothetical protein
MSVIVKDMIDTEITAEMLAAFEKIAAKNVYSIETLETRNRDSLDFHDIHVETLIRMLSEAYELGKTSSR